MAGKAQGVKGQVKIAQRAVAPLHFVAVHPAVIGDVLNHRAHAFEPGVAFEAGEGGGIGGVFKIDPADDAFDKARGIGEAEHVFGLMGGGGGLHQNGAVDALGPQDGGKIGGQIDAVQDGVVLWHPVMVAASGGPEMLMAVDFHDVGASCRMRPADLRSAHRAGGIVALAAFALA